MLGAPCFIAHSLVKKRKKKCFLAQISAHRISSVPARVFLFFQHWAVNVSIRSTPQLSPLFFSWKCRLSDKTPEGPYLSEPFLVLCVFSFGYFGYVAEGNLFLSLWEGTRSLNASFLFCPLPPSCYVSLHGKITLLLFLTLLLVPILFPNSNPNPNFRKCVNEAGGSGHDCVIRRCNDNRGDAKAARIIESSRRSD